MAGRLRSLVSVLVGAVRRLADDDATLLAGALSFFAFISLAPTLLVAAVAVGWVLGPDRAVAEVLRLARELLGPEGGDAVEVLLDPSMLTVGQGWVAALGILAALWGSSRAFVQLRVALNRAWRVEEPRASTWAGRVKRMARERGLSVLAVVGMSLAVLASAVLKTVLASIEAMTSSLLEPPSWVWTPLELLLATAVLALFLALLYRVLPDAEVHRRDVAVGAVLGAVLLQLGTKLLSVYLVSVAARSLTGAAGAIIITLLWLYYSALALLLGAEITAAVAEQRGRPIEPETYLEALDGGR
ncbi:MAG: YihY/virulence factor BrkB family protein [Myxococcales bacterium]|nr:YihY/virulence factor BrkB family protein [Myxococcales bacterium]MCB9716885.1 YihY/virulence factor BrkB family protein [Myxococcales bacterium]